MIIELLFIFLLIAVNGLLAGAEIAVVSVRATRLSELLGKGRAGAVALKRLRDDPERFLATVQVGITVVGASAAAFGGANFAEDLAPLLVRLSLNEKQADAVALVLVVGLISFLSVVVGELVPKSLALRVSEKYALLASRPLLALAALASPAVWILTKSSNLVLRAFGDQTNFLEGRVSLQELHEVVGQASRSGAIDAGTAELASRAIEMSELTAEDVMVHRRFVVTIPASAPPERLRETFLASGHRRIIVHGKSIDDVKGFVTWRDVVERLAGGRELDIAELLRPVPFIPQTRSAVGLLREMREARFHVAVVLDEHGGMAGIVTLEDLLEELVGEIGDEHSRRPPQPVAAASAEGLVVPGPTPIREVERSLRVDLEEAADGAMTMGGLAVTLAGDRIPVTGERLRAAGVEIEILDASPRRVRSLRVRRSD